MSTTLTPRMGIAVPSVVEASRGLPSVKADAPSADDDLVTSVAISSTAIDEPVSPELALVDPELAARLRALLPDIEPQIALGPEPPVLRALPDPEPETVLAFPPTPELPDGGGAVAPAPVLVYPSRGERLRSLAKAFAAGAAVATVVTVGVISELGEGPASQADDPGTVPPRSAIAAPGAPDGASTAAPKPKAGPKSRAGGASSGAAPGTKKRSTKAGRAATPKQPSSKRAGAAKQAGTSRRATKPAATQKRAAKSKQTTKPAAPAAEPRRFAWAPVEGAVAYRVELFRESKQVFTAKTKDPFYELAVSWRHRGQAERLTPGSYRWYVWPVLRSGAADKAVVQAKLSIP